MKKSILLLCLLFIFSEVSFGSFKPKPEIKSSRIFAKHVNQKEVMDVYRSFLASMGCRPEAIVGEAVELTKIYFDTNLRLSGK